MTRTRIGKSQISLNEIFSVERILAARGFTISKSDSTLNTLMRIEVPTEEQISEFFESFDSTEKRRKMLTLAVDNSGEKYQENRKLFSNTLEWYIGEVLVRKFSSIFKCIWSSGQKYHSTDV